MLSHQDMSSAAFNGRKWFGDLKHLQESVRILAPVSENQRPRGLLPQLSFHTDCLNAWKGKKSIKEEAQIPILPLTVASIDQGAMQWQLICPGLLWAVCEICSFGRHYDFWHKLMIFNTFFEVEKVKNKCALIVWVIEINFGEASPSTTIYFLSGCLPAYFGI